MSKKRSCYLRYKAIFSEHKRLARSGPYPEGPTHVLPRDGTAFYTQDLKGDRLFDHYKTHDWR